MSRSLNNTQCACYSRPCLWSCSGSLRSFWQRLRVHVHLSCEAGPFRVQVSAPLKHSKPSTAVKKHGHDQRASDIPLSPAAHMPAVQVETQYRL